MKSPKKYLIPALVLFGLGVLSVSQWLLAESADAEEGDREYPATVTQLWPRFNADGSVDTEAVNLHADTPGGNDEAFRCFLVKPPVTIKVNGEVVVARVCGVHLEILDENGNVDQSVSATSREGRMLEKSGKTKQQVGVDGKTVTVHLDRWRSTPIAGLDGRVSWWSPNGEDPMPENGFHFVAPGGTGEFKDRKYRDCRFRLTSDGNDSAPNNATVCVLTECTNKRKPRIDVRTVRLAPLPEGGLVPDPDDGGYLCALGTTGRITLSASGEDALADYDVKTSLSVDEAGTDPSRYGINAAQEPVPESWALTFSHLAGTTDAAARAELSIAVPDDSSLVLKDIYLVACTSPGEPSNVGDLSWQLRIKFVASMTDYDGDGLPNSEDPTPMGR